LQNSESGSVELTYQSVCNTVIAYVQWNTFT